MKIWACDRAGSPAQTWIAPLLAAWIAVAGAGATQAGSTAAQVSFTYGVLAFEQGDNEEAVRRFTEAVQNDPDEGTFLHWLGLADLRLGRAADAVTNLEESLQVRWPPAAGRARVTNDLRLARGALAGKPDAALAVSAPEYHPEVPRVAELPRWQGRIALASGWDSNPELLTEDRSLLVPGTVSGDSSDAAAYLDAMAGFHPFFDRRGWSLGLDLAGHQTKHREHDGLDLALVAGAASLGWGGDPQGALEGPLGGLAVPAGQGALALLLQAGGSRAWLSGELYRGTVDVAASLFVHETPVTTTRIGLSWSDRDFSDEGLGRFRPTGEELSGSLDQTLLLGRPDRSLRFGVAAGRYDADPLFERKFREASAAAAIPLVPRWTLYLTGAVTDDEYAKSESSLAQLLGISAQPPRRDGTWRASATAIWRATDRLSWTVRASHTRRDSNVEIPFFGETLLDYERTLVSAGFEWLF